MLVAALDADRAAAMKAFGVLGRLVARTELPAEQVESVEATLVRMQAVPRLCNLLRPDIPGWTGEEKTETQGEWLVPISLSTYRS